VKTQGQHAAHADTVKLLAGLNGFATAVAARPIADGHLAGIMGWRRQPTAAGLFNRIVEASLVGHVLYSEALNVAQT
jgi:hypothetical protein